MDLSILNKEQKEAVLYDKGPLLVVAGAGSGKTRVITYKIAYLIEKGIKPERILAITFTRKAAKEMKERATQLAGITSQLHISTFHSFCVGILRDHIGRVGYKQNFSIYDGDDCKKIITEIIKDKFPEDKTKYKAAEFMKAISDWKRMFLEPEQIEVSEEDSDFHKKAVLVYTEYQRILKLYNAIDLDDIIFLAVKVLENNKDIRDRIKERFEYIFIDEYQDTDPLQFRLVKCITDNNSRITVVGDEDQSIYKFRGADIKNIQSFETVFNAKKIVLDQNYRSTNYILKGANSVIKNNFRTTDKKLWSKLGDGNKIKLVKYYTDKDEAENVAKEIKRLNDYKNTAILYRANYLSRLFEEALRKQNIPYNITDGLGFYEREEIKDILSYLRLMVNHEDVEAFSRIINKPKRGIGAAVISKILSIPDSDILYKLHCLDSIKLSDKVREALSVFVKTFDELQNESRIIDMISTIYDNIYRDYLMEEYGNVDKKAYDEDKLQNKTENINELKNTVADFIRSYIDAHPELTEQEKKILINNDAGKLQDFLSELTINAPTEDENDIDNTVKLMTFHGAKGLEYENVFMVGLNNGIFPRLNVSKEEESYMTDEEKQELKDEYQEERRLFYVGVTRAKRNLQISCYVLGYRFYQEKYYDTSMFLNELDKTVCDIKDLSKDY